MAITVRFRGGPVHDQLQVIEPHPVWRVPVHRARSAALTMGSGALPVSEPSYTLVNYYRTDYFDRQGYVIYAVRGEPNGYTVCG